eukprot:4517824-Amphidinium_carterae.1
MLRRCNYWSKRVLDNAATPCPAAHQFLSIGSIADFPASAVLKQPGFGYRSGTRKPVATIKKS